MFLSLALDGRHAIKTLLDVSLLSTRPGTSFWEGEWGEGEGGVGDGEEDTSSKPKLKPKPKPPKKPKEKSKEKSKEKEKEKEKETEKENAKKVVEREDEEDDIEPYPLSDALGPQGGGCDYSNCSEDFESMCGRCEKFLCFEHLAFHGCLSSSSSLSSSSTPATPAAPSETPPATPPKKKKLAFGLHEDFLLMQELHV